ncbi:MAG: hypothetical protein ACRCVX_02390 [Shewanella sp.]
MIVIGIDPDTAAHGVAVFKNGKLTSLHNLSLMELQDLVIDLLESGEVVAAIEDVDSQKFVYHRNEHSSKAAQSLIAMKIGKCAQAGVEAVRMLEHHGVKVAKYPPQRDNWAAPKLKAKFERYTGWSGSSNDDNRSAAYFGYLETRRYR